MVLLTVILFWQGIDAWYVFLLHNPKFKFNGFLHGESFKVYIPHLNKSIELLDWTTYVHVEFEERLIYLIKITTRIF